MKWNVSKKIKKSHLIDIIKKMNSRRDIHGIMVYMPLPDHLNEHLFEIVNHIDSKKDVDNLTEGNYHKMIVN